MKRMEEDEKGWKRVKESEGEWKRVDESRSDWTCRRRRKGLTNIIIISRCKMVGILNKHTSNKEYNPKGRQSHFSLSEN